MTPTLFGIPWYVWGTICLVIAAIYLVVWPRPRGKAARPRSRGRHIVLRWSHTVVWALLAASCFAQSLQAPGVAFAGAMLALLAGVLYLVFLGALVMDLGARRRPE